ncbi:MAG TPA: dethiobiotin synthase [Cyclobacteriaceae bacterium]|nr:dethiobiotin synthase [Cyclobacteriaceae bacterium]
MNYFVTGIDTDSGKTIACAILCEALKADYWKPVQAGFPRDLEMVRNLVSNPTSIYHPETYLLTVGASPHAAAKVDGVTIQVSDFHLPKTNNTIIIEGAGGCLVPLNDENFVIDLAIHFKCPVILVSDLYLGSINHTLLTVEALKKRNLEIRGIIFNGEPNSESERIILHHTALPCLLHISKEDFITKEIVRDYARVLQSSWHD